MNSPISRSLRRFGIAACVAIGLAIGHAITCRDSLHAQHAQAITKPVASASGAAGKWLLHYEYQPRALHGKPAPIENIEVLLTLRAARDSITGEWQRILPPGQPPLLPYVVRGIQRGDSVFLQLVPLPEEDEGMIASALHDIAVFMRTYVHGMPPTTSAIAALIRGDVLTGTRTKVLLDGTPNGKAEPLAGSLARP
jgi:hypothetical protein